MKWKASKAAHKYNEDKLSLLTELSKLTQSTARKRKY